MASYISFSFFFETKVIFPFPFAQIQMLLLSQIGTWKAKLSEPVQLKTLCIYSQRKKKKTLCIAIAVFFFFGFLDYSMI